MLSAMLDEQNAPDGSSRLEAHQGSSHPPPGMHGNNSHQEVLPGTSWSSRKAGSVAELGNEAEDH